LRGESEKNQKAAHLTTNNADVTDVEEEAANSVTSAWFFLDKAGEAFVASTSE
jgi:hypothetical protein